MKKEVIDGIAHFAHSLQLHEKAILKRVQSKSGTGFNECLKDFAFGDYSQVKETARVSKRSLSAQKARAHSSGHSIASLNEYKRSFNEDLEESLVFHEPKKSIKSSGQSHSKFEDEELLQFVKEAMVREFSSGEAFEKGEVFDKHHDERASMEDNKLQSDVNFSEGSVESFHTANSNCVNLILLLYY
eukprot:TRINITY_DN15914_c0_g2_i3.p1 TRINITY_DN15914_c0_g2~~TRINITY_DN15914_c0_g2_i3.p1  ORF type:complete len:208 (+),score=44.55 TRINITY_DN15914_c0_g2_i3:66-626(+)